QPAPSWLTEAEARLGSSLDLTQTASEVVDAAVPGFADAAMIYAAERLLSGGDLTSPQGGPRAAVRRLAARMAGRDATAADSPVRPGEVLVLGPDEPGARTMATGEPILFDRLDGETTARTAPPPGAT